jgi:hypothetical protein
MGKGRREKEEKMNSAHLRELVPMSLEITEQEKETMIRFNKLVGELFDQNEYLKVILEKGRCSMFSWFNVKGIFC